MPLTEEDAERWFQNFSTEELRVVADVARRLSEGPLAGLPSNLPTDLPVREAWPTTPPPSRGLTVSVDWLFAAIEREAGEGLPYERLTNGNFDQATLEQAVRQLIRGQRIVLREGILYDRANDPDAALSEAWNLLPIRSEEPPPARRQRQWPASRVPNTTNDLMAAVQDMRAFGDDEGTIDLYVKTVHEMWSRQDMTEVRTEGSHERTALDHILDDDEPQIVSSGPFTVIEGDLDADGRALPETARLATGRVVRAEPRPEQLLAWVAQQLGARSLSMHLLASRRPVGVTEAEIRRVLQNGLERGLWQLDRNMCLVLTQP